MDNVGIDTHTIQSKCQTLQDAFHYEGEWLQWIRGIYVGVGNTQGWVGADVKGAFLMHTILFDLSD